MPVMTPTFDIVAMCQRALGERISHEEAIAQLKAEYRAQNLFFRSGVAFIASAYKAARQVEIDDKQFAVWQDKCSRCGGAGGWQGWPGFTCYRCGGQCWEPNLTKERLYTADEIDRLDAIAAKKEANRKAKADRLAAKAAEALEARKAELRETEELFRDLEAEAEGDEFLTSILEQWGTKELTDRQRLAAHEAIFRKRAKRERDANSHHVGTEGEKISFEGTVVASQIIGQGFSFQSVRKMIRIVTTEGATLVWFTESGGAIAGKTVSGTAKVKKHDTYKGVAQTIITHVKFN